MKGGAPASAAEPEQSLQRTEPLEEEQKAHQERLQDMLDERERLLDDQEDADLQLNQAKKNLESRQAERSRAEQALRDTRRTLVQVETAQVQVKAHQNELTNRIDTLRKNHQGSRKRWKTKHQCSSSFRRA